MKVTIDILKSDPKDSWETLIENISKLPIYEKVINKTNVEKLINYIESFLESDEYLAIKTVINSEIIYFVYKDGVVVMTPECALTDETWDYIKELREDVLKREENQKNKKD